MQMEYIYYNSSRSIFDKKQYKMLSEKVACAAEAGDADAIADLNDIKKAMDSFFSYVNAVDMSEIRISLAFATMAGQELRDYIMMWDSNRRSHHEAAIINVRAINRYARFYGCSRIFLGDDNSREDVADFCLQVTVEIFRDGRAEAA